MDEIRSRLPGSLPLRPPQPPVGIPARWILGALLLLIGAFAPQAAGGVNGLPLTRFYSYEEIGRVSRGARVSFDALGRTVVTQEDEYVVLNDNNWLRLSGDELAGIDLQATTPDLDGTMLYGALGSWGLLVPTPSGQYRPQSLVPATYPKWVLATNFSQILCRPEGVYFAGWNGVAFRERQTGSYQFFPIPGLSRVFLHQGTLYVASHDLGMLVLDVQRHTLEVADARLFGGRVIVDSAVAGPDAVILATSYRELLLFRGGELQPLPPPLGPRLPTTVTVLQSLAEGAVAVSIPGEGVHILDDEGRLKLSLTGPEYAHVTALASHEPGVLWAATETGVIKILYRQPLTTFRHSIGIPISWPQVVSWNGQLVIGSGGRIYTPTSTTSAGTTRFQQMSGQPAAGVWGLAAVGSSLLVGNKDNLYTYDAQSGSTVIVPGVSATRLVALDATTCLVIGPERIAAVRNRDGRWEECAPRIPGVGYPSIVHAGRGSAWIELGVNRAARVTLKAGRLEAQVFENFPWTRPSWVNISVVGATVVLAGSEDKRVYFDEEQEKLTATSALDPLFRESPYPLVRLCRDEAGVYWGSHQHGVLSASAAGGHYTFDSNSYRTMDERVPLVRALPDGGLWVSTGRSLYHLNPALARPSPSPLQPTLVAVRDSRTNTVIVRRPNTSVLPRPLRYDENNVTFQFFAGSYASMRSSAYEYRLNNSRWRPVISGSDLTLTDLHEGSYDLRVRLVDQLGPLSGARSFTFTVSPPWYRRWYALASYPLLLIAALAALVRVSMRRAQARTAELEKLVTARTGELQDTMQKLQQETRTSATLAERNRLAGEIHDSLEQGFTGLTLQLETTANFASCPPEVKSGLTVALNMVAFSRSEVRNAVRDMHSSILTSADLETALRQILAQVAPHPDYASVRVQGTPHRLESTIEHHLLRIAQEAIANAVKHANARHLDVAIGFGANEVELTVSDDGRGFDVDTVLQGDSVHFGLPSFRGRAAKMGGTVEIASHPGAGTRISIRVPVQPSVPL
jgi:signal transduction histidine kinase